MVQWWEHSPPTNVSRVWFLDPASYVGWVCCWFSKLLLREVFLQVFPSPQKPTFPNSNSIWIIVKHFIMSLCLGRSRTKHSLCLTLNVHLHFFFYLSVSLPVSTRIPGRWTTCVLVRNDITPNNKESYQDPVFWAWLSLFSALRGTNYKATHCLTVMFLLAQYPKRNRKCSHARWSF